MNVSSWGRCQAIVKQQKTPAWRNNLSLSLDQTPILPSGMLRSYGDSCLLADGTMLSSRNLNHFIDFNEDTGVLHCESGVVFADILALMLPKGWFLPVVPGTKYVTVGGAIANDIHGKNHHNAASFGAHVLSFTLLRSDGQHLLCSATENSEYFYATIGGLGLTGFIIDVKIQLVSVSGDHLAVDYVPFADLKQFIALAKESEVQFDYTVAWFDCMRSTCRGVFMRANFMPTQTFSVPEKKGPMVPFEFPGFVLNGVTIKLFNRYYYQLQSKKGLAVRQHYDGYFFPLDGIQHWNRIYGAKGFYQFQCVLPWDSAEAAGNAILKTIAKARQGSFLAVLKTLGSLSSGGLLSFPMPGVTIALDFADKGVLTTSLLEHLYAIVAEAGGRVYPAKDCSMPAKLFAAGYPALDKFKQFKDPCFTSDLWQRLVD